MGKKNKVNVGDTDEELCRYGKRLKRTITKLKEEMSFLEQSKFAVRRAMKIFRRADQLVRRMAAKFNHQLAPENFRAKYAIIAAEIKAIISFCKDFLGEELLTKQAVVVVIDAPVGMIDGEWN